MDTRFEAYSKSTRFTDFCESVQHCTLCSRLRSRSKVMSARNGNIDSKVVFVAEAPGRLGADRTGIPLYGDKTGENFERLMSVVGWRRDEVFITNAVLCNPREGNGNNAPPTGEELSNCSAYLHMTIELVQPEVVVSLGTVALKALETVVPHGLTLRNDVATPSSWAGRLIVPLYHPGPRALIHRSSSKQAVDFSSLAALAHPTKGLLEKRTQLAATEDRLEEAQFSRLQHLVVAIVQALGRVTYFKLTKLLYLTDLLALDRFGDTLTGEVYLRQAEGPWPPSLKKAMALLDRYEVLIRGGNRIPCVELGPSPRFVPQVRENAEGVVAEVLARYGSLTNSEIKTATYLTRPMRYILREERKGTSMGKVPVLYRDRTAIDIHKSQMKC